MIVFDVLTKKDCQILRKERNKIKGTWRTSYLLTEGMQDEFFEEYINNRNNMNKNRFWAIRKQSKNIDEVSELLGMAGLTNMSFENRNAEINLFIRKMYSKKGYGKLSLEMLLEIGFNEINLSNIYGEVYKSNPCVGFWEKYIEENSIYSVLLPNRKYHDGKFFDSIYFNFFKPFNNHESL